MWGRQGRKRWRKRARGKEGATGSQVGVRGAAVVGLSDVRSQVCSGGGERATERGRNCQRSLETQRGRDNKDRAALNQEEDPRETLDLSPSGAPSPWDICPPSHPTP